MADERVFNFGAGPSVLPVPVLEEARRDLVALPGVGMSVLEISHRSKTFERILGEADADLRSLASIPPGYRILFLQGGASLQFSMVPMNLLGAGQSADYVLTGVWSKKALKEARRQGATRVAASTEAEAFARIPAEAELDLDPAAAYLHVTSNNTIYGTQWTTMPDAGEVPLVCDASSDFFSRPFDVSSYGLIYGGAQKNLGPAGLTLVIVREDLIERSAETLPSMLSYKVYAAGGSLYNTPPVFAIYLTGLVAKWLLAEGGLSTIAGINERKAARLYAEIDRTEFYRGHAAVGSRSRMNVTFRLPDESLEAAFLAEAARQGLDGLKGHRSVGGLRASIYNAFPEQGVDVLVQFMKEFERVHG